MSAPTNAVLGALATQSVTNTISASDAPVVSVANAPQVTEGTNSLFPVSLSNISTTDTLVTLTTTTGTAGTTDFTMTTTTITIPAGQLTGVFTVPTLTDAISGEPIENFTAAITGVTGGTGATFNPAPATGTIADATGLPTITISAPQTVAEGTAADNTITLSNPSAVSVTVTLATAGNGTTPTVAADLGAQTYSTDGTTFNPVPASGIITIPAGVTTVTVRTATINDTTGEPAETFGVTLSAPTNAVLGALATQSVTNTISASDAPVVSVANAPQVTEGTNSLFPVSLSNISTTDTLVTLTTTTGTAGTTDFTMTTTTITIPAGQLTGVFTVPTLTDAISGEPIENFTAAITGVTGGTGATFNPAPATGTIADATGLPTITISAPQTVAEGTAADNTITLSNPSAVSVTVTLATAGNGTTPTVAADLGAQTYSTDGTTFNPVPASGIITIPAGVTTVTVRTATINDTTGEPAETFGVTLSAPTNAVLGALATQSVTNTISASDAPVVSVANAPQVTEGTNSLFPVSLSNISTTDTLVTLTTTTGTAGTTDFTMTTTTITIPAGQLTGVFTVPTLTDAISGEPIENFTAAITGVTGGTGATFNPAPATGTIADATGLPTITISAPQTVAEGTAADNTITLSNPSAVSVTVTLATAGNGTTPTVAADLGAQTYSTDGTTFNPVPASGIITIPAGVTTVTVRTATINDTTGEPAETFGVTLSAPTNAVLGALATQSVTNTISASDAPVVSVANAPQVTEGTNSLFPVSLSNISTTDTLVTLTTTTGTAGTTDFTMTTTTITIPAGQLTGVFTVPTLTDAISGEPIENFTAAITGVTGGTGATFNPAPATGTIADATGLPTITISAPQTVAEGTAADNTITLSNPSAVSVTVTLATAGNGTTPTVAADLGAQTYSTDGTTFNPVPASGIITIPAGVTTVTVRTATINDTTGEPAETFGVTLSAPTNAVLGALATQSVTNTISASDAPVVSVANAPQVTEGTNSLFPVSLSNISTTDTLVTLTTTTGTAGTTDFTMTTTTITIPAGQLTGVFTVPTLTDAISGEPIENFTAAITGVTGGTGATFNPAPATGTIADATGLPTITISAPQTVAEGTAADNTITLSNPSAVSVTVTLATAGNGTTPTVAADLGAQTYSTDGTTFNPVPASGIITIPAGVTTVTVRTATINDTTGEPAETFGVTLSAPTNAVLGALATQSVTNTISASDAPVVSVANAPQVTEGTNSLFPVSLSNISTTDTLVTLTTTTGTAGTTDFTMTTTTITIPAGQLTGVFTVPTLTDAISGEPIENFTAAITGVTGGTGATFNPAPATGTIADATGLPTITISAPQTVAEGTAADNTITLSNPSAVSVTVTLATAGNGTTPTVAADLGAQTYSTDGTTFNPVPASGIITIPAGVTTVTVRTATINDTTGEPAETFGVTLSAPTNAVLGALATQSVTNTISASDAPVVSVANAPQVTEGTNSLFPVSLSNISTTDTLVTLTTTTGTAGTTDFTMTTTTITIPAGQLTGVFTVPTLTDAISGEPIENFTAAITGVTGGTGATFNPAPATGTIADATGLPTITISAPQTVAEGTAADNTITLSNPSAVSVTVTLATAGNGTTPTVAADLGAQTYSTDGTTFNPVPASGIITIPAGVTTVTVRTATINDTTGEPAETFGVTLSAPTNAVLGALATQSVTNTISASDAPVVSVANAPQVTEGTNSLFPVSLSNISTTDTLVTLTTTTGTAGTTDFTMTTTTITIPAGQLTGVFTVPTLTDAISGEPIENFTAAITGVTGGTGATFNPAPATGTIADATGLPTITISAPQTVAEGTAADNTITLSNPSAVSVTVTLATAGNGTTPTVAADLGAQTYSTDGTTFNPVPASGIITIPAGVTTVTVRTATAVDSVVEPAETFSIRLNSPVGAVLGAAGTQTVQNIILGQIFLTVTKTVSQSPLYHR